MNWEIRVDIHKLLCMKKIMMTSYCIVQGTLSVLCTDLDGREIQKRGDLCKHIADSLCGTAETSNTGKQLYPNQKINNTNKNICLDLGQNLIFIALCQCSPLLTPMPREILAT